MKIKSMGYIVKIGKCYLTSNGSVFGNHTISDCLSEAYVFKIYESAKAKPDKYVAIIDYIGLVKVNGRQDRWLQVGKITRELKIIANEYNIPVIALAQLNRGVESRQNKEPLLSDLRESGSIEQDSNVVAFLYRPDDENRELVKLSIRKNREGSLGDISYYFDGKYMYFKETDEVE